MEVIGSMGGEIRVVDGVCLENISRLVIWEGKIEFSYGCGVGMSFL